MDDRFMSRHAKQRGTGLASKAVAALGLCWSIVTPLAHEGHDHAAPGDAAAPPSPTAPAATPGAPILPETAMHSHAHWGRVVMAPNGTWMVQASGAGTIAAAPGRELPVSGERVKAGEVLAQLVPLLNPAETLDYSRALAEGRREYPLAKAGHDNMVAQNPDMAASGLGIAVLLENDYRGNSQRIQQLEKARAAVPLKTPRAGVGVVVADLSAGQVVRAGSTLFEIVDPADWWVEVFADVPKDAWPAVVSLRLPNGEKGVLHRVRMAYRPELQNWVALYRPGQPSRRELAEGTPVQIIW